MASPQTISELQNYINQHKEPVMSFVRKVPAMALDYIVTTVVAMAVGYEVNKLACDGPKNVWTVAEFFGISTLCTWRWIVDYCSLNHFCANFCISYVKWGRSQDGDTQNADAPEVDEELTMVESILQRVQMVLGTLESGVFGFELRYKLFDTMPLNNWDYDKLIKYLTVIKIIIYVIKCCHWCLKGRLFKKEGAIVAVDMFGWIYARCSAINILDNCTNNEFVRKTRSDKSYGLPSTTSSTPNSSFQLTLRRETQFGRYWRIGHLLFPCLENSQTSFVMYLNGVCPTKLRIFRNCSCKVARFRNLYTVQQQFWKNLNFSWRLTFEMHYKISWAFLTNSVFVQWDPEFLLFTEGFMSNVE